MRRFGMPLKYGSLTSKSGFRGGFWKDHTNLRRAAVRTERSAFFERAPAFVARVVHRREGTNLKVTHCAHPRKKENCRRNGWMLLRAGV